MNICSYGCGKEAIKQFKNGKYCCSERPNSCSSFIEKMSATCRSSERYKNKNPAFVEKTCSFCGRKVMLTTLRRHEKSCYLNPENITLCPVCDTPIKDYTHTTTCSNKCSKIYFVSTYNESRKNRKDLTYRTICFKYHKKECIICKENNIVHVHHYDGNTDNNAPLNLLPFCATHHQYMHSKFIKLIIEKVELYRQKWEENNKNMPV